MHCLHRRDVVNELLRDRGDILVIAGLGAPNWDVSAAGDHANNFPLWGAMGAATMMGLGLALAQPKRKVLVITGDGEMLMSIGSLATVAVEKPPNLTIAVLDNERFGETGMQKTHTRFRRRTSPASRWPPASAPRKPSEPWSRCRRSVISFIRARDRCSRW